MQQHATESDSRQYTVLLVVIALAAALRLYHLFQPMRYDEAWSYIHYSSQPLSIALSDYTTPNNHIFHTLLVWFTTRVLGDAPWVVRLPAFIGGVALVPATWAVGRRFAGASAGLIAAALVAALPSMVLYSTNARGYMNICLAFMLLLLIADRLLTAPTRKAWAAFAVVVALGAYTAPIMMYPAGVVALWMLFEKERTEGPRAAFTLGLHLAVALTAAAALTLVAYTPVIVRAGIGPLTGNRFVVALPWRDFVASLPEFVRAVRNALATGLSAVVPGAVVAACGAALIVRSGRRGGLQSLAIAVVCWSTVLLVASRHAPPGRVFLFLAPLLCVYTAIGIATVLELVATRRHYPLSQLATTTALAIVLGLGAETIWRRTVFRSEETDWLGLRDAAPVARYLLANLGPQDRLVTIDFGPTLSYYLLTYGGKPIESYNGSDRKGRLVVVLNHEHDQTIEGLEKRHREVPWDQYGQPEVVETIGKATVEVLAPRSP